jgi:hypothetical protein
MQNEQARYAISTDQVGFFGQHVPYLQGVTPDNLSGVNRVEVVALRPVRSLQKFVRDLEQNGYEIAQIHGRTGILGTETLFDSMKLHIIEFFTPTTKQLVEQFPDKEILIHAPEAAKPRVQEALKAAKPKFVWIENHPGGDSELQKALCESNILASQGVRSGVMLDITHFLVDYAKTPLAQKWDNMLQRLHTLADTQANIQGIHLCIGTTTDMLQLDQLTDRDLRNLSDVLVQFPIRTFVYENQQQGVSGLLGDGALKQDQMRKRTGGIMRRLSTVGLAPVA